MFSTRYNIYKTNVYDLLKKESNPTIVYQEVPVDREVVKEVIIEKPFEESQTYRAMNQTITDTRKQVKTASIQGLNEGFQKGHELGKLEGLAMATTPLLGRRIIETKEDSVENLRDKIEPRFEIPSMFKKKTELLNPITDEVSNLDELVHKVYEKQLNGEDYLDKPYYDEKKWADDNDTYNINLNIMDKINDKIENTESKVMSLKVAYLAKEKRGIQDNSLAKEIFKTEDILKDLKQQLHGREKENKSIEKSLGKKLTGKLKKEMLFQPESKQFGAPKSRDAIDVLLNGIEVGKKTVVYPSYEIAKKVEPIKFSQTNIINELESRYKSFIESMNKK